jgi:hypothetical protein
VLCLTLAVAFLALTPARGETLSATPETLGSVFNEAGPGDQINLAPGDYGTFDPGLKPDTTEDQRIRVLGAPDHASVMELDCNPCSNVVIDGLTVTWAHFAHADDHNVVIRNSDVPGQVWLDTREVGSTQPAKIRLRSNDFHDWDTCSSCGEARLWLTGGNSESGIVIRENVFRGGLSDGIQNGSTGTRIISNEFHSIECGSPSGVHTDAIQLYGSSETLIKGNYMHDQPCVPFIMAPDGLDHEVIIDNVVEGTADGYPYITIFSDDSSVIEHNTFASTVLDNCAFNITCGVIRVGYKEGQDDPGHGTIIRNNIGAETSIESGSVEACDHNLWADPGGDCPDNLIGRPLYLGGLLPQTMAGYRLAPGSLGEGAATDGLDLGAGIP